MTFTKSVITADRLESAAATDPPMPGTRRRPSDASARTCWTVAHTRRVRLTDALVIAAAVVLGQGVRFGFGSSQLAPVGAAAIPAPILVAMLVLAWLLALAATRSRDSRILGSGATEYNRILGASFAVFGAFAIVDLLLGLSVARGFLAFLFPVGTAGLLVSRWLWRRSVARRRRRGQCLQPILVVGDAMSAWTLMRRLTEDASLGYTVVGICVPDATEARLAGSLTGPRPQVPVFCGLGAIGTVLARTGASAVAVDPADAPSTIRELSWELDEYGVDLLVAPGLTDLAGPRITLRPHHGLALLHVEKPRYQAASALTKLGSDKLLAVAGLVLAAPVMLLCAAAVKLSSPGPVFYGGERIGTGGSSFRMWKFRTMLVGADAMRSDLEQLNQCDGPLFKIHDDPRVTRAGRFLRRYSLDELPQLFNVLNGSMSLVGPRPPLPGEAAQYDDVVRRRLLVRPGITGLWQVSGRSDLSWEESVELDLSYVENWSLIGDLMILCRTVRVVLARDGAY